MAGYAKSGLACLMAAATCFGTGSALAGQKAQALLPDAPGPETARVAERPLKSNDYFVYGSLIAGSHVTVSGGRGSLAVGLLFGPLGVAANAAHAQSVNEERSKPLDALARIDAVAALKAARSTAAPAAADVRAYELMPVVAVRFEDDKAFRLSCMLTASLPNPGKRDWHSRYSVEMAGRFDSGSPASIDAAGQVIAPCLAEANRLFETHARGGLQLGETAKPVVINGKTVSLRVVDAEYPARFVVPDILGVMEWPTPESAMPVPPCACDGTDKAESGAVGG